MSVEAVHGTSVGIKTRGDSGGISVAVIAIALESKIV